MAYVYQDQLMWLCGVGSVIEGTGYGLCDRHADRLSPPVGWVLEDRRTPMRLFSVPDVA